MICRSCRAGCSASRQRDNARRSLTCWWQSRSHGKWATASAKSAPAVFKLARTLALAVVISQFSYSSTGCGDLLPRGGREPVRADLKRNAYLALAEHLHKLVSPDCALGDQILRRHLTAGRIQPREAIQVHDLVSGLELRVRETLELWQPPVERHLTALEELRDVVPGLAALGAATR